MSEFISRQEVSDIIKTRLYQTALNNDEYITSYAKACEDIAENRIDTWISEAKTVEPERKPGKWIRAIDPDVNAWTGGHTCSECGRACVQMSMNYCANCGAPMEVDNGKSKN